MYMTEIIVRIREREAAAQKTNSNLLASARRLVSQHFS
jgi:hypothetical protein